MGLDGALPPDVKRLVGVGPEAGFDRILKHSVQIEGVTAVGAGRRQVIPLAEADPAFALRIPGADHSVPYGVTIPGAELEDPPGLVLIHPIVLGHDAVGPAFELAPVIAGPDRHR